MRHICEEDTLRTVGFIRFDTRVAELFQIRYLFGIIFYQQIRAYLTVFFVFKFVVTDLIMFFDRSFFGFPGFYKCRLTEFFVVLRKQPDHR